MQAFRQALAEKSRRVPTFDPNHGPYKAGGYSNIVHSAPIGEPSSIPYKPGDYINTFRNVLAEVTNKPLVPTPQVSEQLATFKYNPKHSLSTGFTLRRPPYEQ